MKFKKIVAILVGIGFVGVSGGMGFYFGQERNTPIVEPVVASKVVTETTESTKIAVANLDEGAKDKKETVYYADKVIQFPSTSFEYTSLEEARKGLESGKYGAYVIIPATFSQSVASINTEPQSTKLEYALNRNLSGKSQYTLLYNVLSFGESINNSLSYMYLNNILSEFHDAQDGASKVMKNDLVDKAAIDKIRPSDLVKFVEIPETKREKNNIENLDVEQYVNKNTAVANEIDDKYLACVAETQEQLDKIKEGGVSLSEVLHILSDNVQKIDISKDQEGNAIAQVAGNKLTSTLNQELENSQRDNQVIIHQISQLQTETDALLSQMQRTIKKNNENRTKELSDILVQYQNAMIGQIPQLVAVRDEVSGAYTLSFGSTSVEGVPTLQFSLTDASGDSSQIEANKSLLQTISAKLLEEAAGEKTVSEVLVGFDEDEEVMKKLETAGYTKVTEFLQQQSTGGVGLETSKAIVMNGDPFAFKDYIGETLKVTSQEYQVKEFEDFVYDDQGNVQLNEKGESVALGSLFEDHKETLLKTNENVLAYHKLNIDGIKKIFDSDYVEPFEKNADKAKQEFAQRYESETKAIGEYRQQIDTYKPIVESGFIGEKTAEMQENNALLQKEVIENNQEYVEYANKVYDTTEKNINGLKDHIKKAQDVSEKTVNNGLSSAKEIKGKTSFENQTIMGEFSKKLPYTRLGTMEYTQAYEFIANPIGVSDTSAPESKKEVSIVKEPIKELIEEQEEGNVVFTYLIYEIFGALVLVLVVLLIRRRIKRPVGEQ